jgi:hypothetical protein
MKKTGARSRERVPVNHRGRGWRRYPLNGFRKNRISEISST